MRLTQQDINNIYKKRLQNSITDSFASKNYADERLENIRHEKNTEFYKGIALFIGVGFLLALFS